MDLVFDAPHILGYASAFASLFMGAGQIHKIVKARDAKNVSIVDPAVRTFASIGLGIYSLMCINDIIFIVVNFGSAFFAIGVLVPTRWARKKKAEDESST